MEFSGEIDDERYGGGFVDLLQVLFDIVNLGLIILVRSLPVGGKGGASEIGESVAILHTVNVSHGDEIEIEYSFHGVELNTIEEVVDHALHDERPIHIRCSHPTQNYNASVLNLPGAVNGANRGKVDRFPLIFSLN